MGIPSLDTTDYTTLGAKLVLSAAYFEASSAELIGAEGLKLQKYITAYSADHVSIAVLTSLNREIMMTMGALSSLESRITEKVDSGIALHTSWA